MRDHNWFGCMSTAVPDTIAACYGIQGQYYVTDTRADNVYSYVMFLLESLRAMPRTKESLVLSKYLCLSIIPR